MNAWTWLFQRISALLLLVVLGTHLWFLHFAQGGEVIQYAEIVKRLGTPTLITMDVVLLIFGLYHAIYGVYGVFADFGLGLRARGIVLAVLITAGTGLLVLGIYGFWGFVAGLL